MKKESIAEIAQKQLLYLDGATVSNLLKRGMPAGVCPELWSLEHKEALLQLQREYVEAGSNVIYAPTFTANRIKLEYYGLEDRIEEINKGLVAISKEAADGKAYVAGNVSMTGAQLEPAGDCTLEELIDVYKEQISYLVEAGVDLLAIETMMSLQEMRAAIIAAKEVCNLPIMATMTFGENGRTLYGTDAKTAAIVLSTLGADIVGANCSVGPNKMYDIMKEMSSVCNKPIVCKPNAGLPSIQSDGSTKYDMEPSEFADSMKKIQELGISLLGGCCGTSPEYIKELVNSTKDCKMVNRPQVTTSIITSERQALSIDAGMLAGNQLDTSLNTELQEQLRQSDFDFIAELAEDQEDEGVSVLRIHVEGDGIDEKEAVLGVLGELSLATSLPLMIATGSSIVLEAALRNYAGRALVQALALEEEKLGQLFATGKKYGAMFWFGTSLSEMDKEKVEFVYQTAYRTGLSKEDFIADKLIISEAD